MKHPQLLLALLVLLTIAACNAQTRNGFDLSGASIPASQIHKGGPPRDGIPSIDEPQFISPEAANKLEPEDDVLGVVHNGIAKAYPVNILNWHEIVNDEFNGQPVVVSYCPLCGSGLAFDARVGGQHRNFGVSGLLYNSDVLLYDRESESLWSQVKMKAINGPLKGTPLTYIQTTRTTWADWRKEHPNTRVLSRETGFSRNYNRTPYGGYEQSKKLFFPVANQDNRYHRKEWTLGIEVDGQFKAYPFEELEAARQPVRNQFAGKELVIHYDADAQSAQVETVDGEAYPSVTMFWFAWIGFHPESAVFTAREEG